MFRFVVIRFVVVGVKFSVIRGSRFVITHFRCVDQLRDNSWLPAGLGESLAPFFTNPEAFEQQLYRRAASEAKSDALLSVLVSVSSS